MAKWEIVNVSNGNSTVATGTNITNISYNFPENTSTSEITYAFNYTGDTSCTGTTTIKVAGATTTGDFEVSVVPADCTGTFEGKALWFTVTTNDAGVLYFNYEIKQGNLTKRGTLGGAVGQRMEVSLGTGWTNSQATITWDGGNINGISGSTTVMLPRDCNKLTPLQLHLYYGYVGQCTPPTGDWGPLDFFNHYLFYLRTFGDGETWGNAQAVASDVSVSFVTPFYGMTGLTISKDSKSTGQEVCEYVITGQNTPCMFGVVANLNKTQDDTYSYTLVVHPNKIPADGQNASNDLCTQGF